MKIIKEAVDLSKVKYDKIEKIKSKDDMVLAWHGTNSFWCLWFCLYGVDATIEPPTKTLGRGNSITGFSKIKTSGLFISASKTPGFEHYLVFELKPSEIGVSIEMEELGYTEKDNLKTLKLGDAILIKKITPKRIVKIFSKGKEYTRKEFISLFPDPKKYLEELYKVNMYDDGNPLRRKATLNFFIDDFKRGLKNGEKVEDLIETTKDLIKYKDYENFGLTLLDMQEILKFLNNKIK